MKAQQDVLKIRLHDAIVGILYLSTFFLSMQVDPKFIYATIGVGVLQTMSPIIKFCNNVITDTTSIQNGT